MRLLITIVALALMTAPTNSHHVAVAVPVKVIAVVGGKALAGGAAAVGAGMGFVTGAIAWCGANQPKRNLKRDTFVDGRHDVYPTYNSRKTGCIFKDPKKPHVVSVRG